MSDSQKAAIERYLLTCEHDALFHAWPGESFAARGGQGEKALRDALISLVKSRAGRPTPPEELAGLDVASFMRATVEPMVRGLFPYGERQAVLDLLAHSVIFLTPEAIEPLLQRTRYLKTAWNLARIYLASCGSNLTGDADQPVGLSEGTTCYVSMSYFGLNGPFDDFVVHEAAHIFHNCKRRTIGLPEARGREWLLNIEFDKRETFAYLCEVYSRILKLGGSAKDKRGLLAQVEKGPSPPDDRVVANEHFSILGDAVAARNGWKHILENCAPRHRRCAPHLPNAAFREGDPQTRSSWRHPNASLLFLIMSRQLAAPEAYGR